MWHRNKGLNLQLNKRAISFGRLDCLPQTSPICQAFCAEQETADFELAVDSHIKISVATASVGSFKFWLILWSGCAAVQ